MTSQDCKLIAGKCIKDLSLDIDIKNLEFQDELGRGSFGVVYTAKDKNTEPSRTIVIKKISKKDNDLKMVENEVIILRYLSIVCQEYILCYLGYTYDKDNYYIVTEYLGNYITLEEFIDYYDEDEDEDDSGEGSTVRKGTLSLEKFDTIARNLIAGLQKIHSMDVVHYDIKPGNVMINPDTLNIKYIDFGYSCMKNQCSIRDKGTPGYTAPEIEDAKFRIPPPESQVLEYLKKSDIWSLAYTILELYGISHEKFPLKMDVENIRMIKKINSILRDINLLDMLEFDPMKRTYGIINTSMDLSE